MKNLLFLLAFIITSGSVFSQDCNKFYVDVKKGTLNDLLPSASQEDVKKKLPCFTGNKPDGSKESCGGGVFFVEHSFFFYTGDNYINIRKDFKGEFSIPLFGKTEAELTKSLGESLGSIDDEEDKYVFFKTTYGCVCVKLENGKKVEEIFLYAKPAEEVDLCI